MARSTYSGGTATLHITVEHTWGSAERVARVDITQANGLPAGHFTMPADPDVMREVAQALLGAADEWAIDPADDVTEPAEADEGSLPLTLGERQVFWALHTTKPQTPADLKRAMPGDTPVAVVRDILGRLEFKGYARTASEMAVGSGPTPWVATGKSEPFDPAQS